MRVVREGDSLEDALMSARSEALSAFGNGTVFLERFVSFSIDCKPDEPDNLCIQISCPAQTYRGASP